MIAVDTLRANHLGTYGYEKPTSPRIDEFFESAVVFEDAHSTSSWTLPSFASLMTSVYSSTHGCWGFSDTLRPRFATLAEHLQQSGYHTAAAVSHVFMRRKYGLHQGFAFYDQTLAATTTGDSHKMISSPRLTKQAISFIEGRALTGTSEPWFMWVHYFDPHRIYQRHEGLTGAFGNTLVGRYDGEIAFTDHYIGRRLDRLDELDLADETIVVFVSDHGEEFMDHGRYQHGKTLFTEVARIALAIRYPGISPRRVGEPVSGVDLMPTLLALLGLRRLDSDKVAGQSLEPLMRGDSLGDRGVLLESRPRLRPEVELEAYVTDDWKIILENPREDSGIAKTQVLLFDRKKDPAEERNVATEHPEVVEELTRRLREAVARALGLAQRDGKAERLNLSEEDLRNLKALGYVGELPEEDPEDE